MKIETKFSSKSNIFFHRFSCFFIGLLVPFPFEIMSGLYISYFTSAILIFYLRFNLGILIFLALFFSLIAFSFLMNDLVGSFLSLLIVTYTSIFMVSTVSDKFDVVYFIKGLKLSVFFVLVLFALAAIYVGSL